MCRCLLPYDADGRRDDDRRDTTRRDGDRRRLKPDAAKFKIQNLAAPRGQNLNFEFCKKNDDGDRPTDVALLMKGIQTTLGGITGGGENSGAFRH